MYENVLFPCVIPVYFLFKLCINLQKRIISNAKRQSFDSLIGSRFGVFRVEKVYVGKCVISWHV